MRQFKYLQRMSHEKFKITTDKGFIYEIPDFADKKHLAMK